MNITDQISNEYRQRANYGVQFSIDADAYECRIGDRVSYGDNETEMQGGRLCNYQSILLDGKPVGYLIEVDNGKLFDPMTSSFVIPIADCMDHDLWNEMERTYKDNPHLYDNDEVLELRFATLNQMLDHLSVS